MVNENILGIDIGTTSVKVCVIDINTKEVTGSQKKDTYSDVPSELGNEGNKQDAPRILSALQMCISRLPKEQLKNVKIIGVCGQMHSCMLWKQGSAWEQKPESDRFEIKEVSHLYTWQDSRCSEEFLKSLPTPSSHLSIASGYGCATLCWFLKNQPEKLNKYDRAGTIHDFFVSMLCGLNKPIMSVQNAASWGYLDTVKEEWNKGELSEINFPLDLLPDVVSSGKIAGTLQSDWYGIPKGISVLASLGDLQCSVLPLLSQTTDAVINISTSAQLSFKVPEGFSPPSHPPASREPVEYIPYFNGTYLAVAASLNGGNALAAFIRMIQQWVLELGYQVPQSKIWERTLLLGGNPEATSSLEICPTLYGERHDPQARASVSNIDLGNVTLGKVMQSLCRGIAENLHKMMPRSLLETNGIVRIVGGGSALTRNPILQKELSEVYKLPVDLNTSGDAPYGAALAALNTLQKNE